jgi:diguanylate cyclase (GGDEF)-like protein
MTAVSRKILLNLVDASAEPLLLARIDRPEWPVALANAAFELLDGGGDPVGKPFADVIERLVGRELALEVSETLRAGQDSTIPVETRGREYLLALQPIADGTQNSGYFSARWRTADAQQLSPGTGEAHHALAKANRRIRDLSRDDPTTGLLNSAAFRDVLQHDWAVAAREKSSLALAVFGFDDFDAYSDVFGLHATNSCLRRVAQVIRRSLRRASDVAAWVDGEAGGRIVVLSHGSDEDSVRAFALRIAAAVRELGLHHPRSRISRFVTVSFNLAMLQADGKGKSADKFLDELLGR